ncbi:MAG: hypothetical protein ABS52_07790 [Gemmatimonadetes bacterium SCN 70-22]|nr:MAG: hypothetical protein ABS52_07790 [Gemmatimonadetes bacterium SCN 70-22]
MTATPRDLVFPIRRIARLAPVANALPALQAASDGSEERSEFLTAEGVGILLLLGTDGILRVHLHRDDPAHSPVQGAEIRIATAADGTSDSSPAITDDKGDAALGSVEQFPRPTPTKPYQLFLRLPLAGG